MGSQGFHAQACERGLCCTEGATHHHAKQRAVAVDEEAVLGIASLLRQGRAGAFRLSAEASQSSGAGAAARAQHRVQAPRSQAKRAWSSQRRHALRAHPHHPQTPQHTYLPTIAAPRRTPQHPPTPTFKMSSTRSRSSTAPFTVVPMLTLMMAGRAALAASCVRSSS